MVLMAGMIALNGVSLRIKSEDQFIIEYEYYRRCAECTNNFSKNFIQGGKFIEEVN